MAFRINDKQQPVISNTAEILDFVEATLKTVETNANKAVTEGPTESATIGLGTVLVTAHNDSLATSRPKLTDEDKATNRQLRSSPVTAHAHAVRVSREVADKLEVLGANIAAVGRGEGPGNKFQSTIREEQPFADFESYMYTAVQPTLEGARWVQLDELKDVDPVREMRALATKAQAAYRQLGDDIVNAVAKWGFNDKVYISVDESLRIRASMRRYSTAVQAYNQQVTDLQNAITAAAGVYLTKQYGRIPR